MNYRRKLIDDLCDADRRRVDEVLQAHADVVTVEVAQLLDPEREQCSKAQKQREKGS